ncbi:MAG TPA: SDR family NAD(P)-dependent oxidoreductase, partial [Ilumatobacteraceae bacterium]|nr:SDR family NAD(P)-dependent oxidoreductase [Ilumatobacteraceae bacterium]
MNSSPFDLSGRIALVTGSSRGIGFGLARALGEAGAVIVMNARDQSALESAAATLRSEGLTVHCRPFDVCDVAAVSAAIESIESNIGPVDILVNNAGL